MLFLALVAIGSVWAVYTMQYYDDLGATEQQQGSLLRSPNTFRPAGFS